MFLKSFLKNYNRNIAITAVVIIFIMFVTSSIAPSSFPKGQIDVHVPNSASLSNISESLADQNIITSPFVFKVFVVVFGGQRGLFAGDYRFTGPQSVIRVAYRMVNGNQGLPKIKVTIPEGTNVYDMAYIYLTKIRNFNAPRFVSLALQYEGYLFPDTYNFLSNVKSEEVIKTMRNNFNEKIKTLESDIENSDKIMEEIIIMASIVEEEERDSENRRVIAGILWKRLEEGMPLQVDAPFYYLTGRKGGFTYDDLKIDSPYNTYKYKGLPRGPISNPSLDAIKATLNPVKTTYYYYLTGKDGVTRYSDTYDGHLKNKNVYLR